MEGFARLSALSVLRCAGEAVAIGRRWPSTRGAALAWCAPGRETILQLRNTTGHYWGYWDTRRSTYYPVYPLVLRRRYRYPLLWLLAALTIRLTLQVGRPLVRLLGSLPQPCLLCFSSFSEVSRVPSFSPPLWLLCCIFPFSPNTPTFDKRKVTTG